MNQSVASSEVVKKKRGARTKTVIRVFEAGIIIGAGAIGILIVFLLYRTSLCPDQLLSRKGIIFCISIPIITSAILTELYVRNIKVRSRTLTRYGFSFLRKKEPPLS